MKKLKIDISFVYYIVTIIFVLLVLYFLQSNKEGMENPEKYRIVVAKYQKDVSFLDETGIPYTVVTKEEVPNKGHEATSYLYYIINNYDNLPQNLIFIHDENESWHHTGKITEHVHEWINDFEKKGSTYYEFNFNSGVPEIHPKGIAMDLYSKNTAYQD